MDDNRSPWWMSEWDRRLHAFPELGEVSSEALCTHSAMTSRLIAHGKPGTEDARWCAPCLEIVKTSLENEAKAETRTRWRE